jgi:hypothetical protein
VVGQDIRPIASDVHAGQLVLEEGELIGAAEVGILATVGAATLQVPPPLSLSLCPKVCSTTAILPSVVGHMTVKQNIAGLHLVPDDFSNGA